MVDLEVSHIKIMFEDVENVTIAKEDILVLDLGEVRKEICGWGKVEEIRKVEDVSIIIKESVNKESNIFESDKFTKKAYLKDSRTVIKRIVSRDNIVRLVLYSGKDCIGSYEVSWSNEGRVSNNDVKYDINNSGDLLITINKGGKVKDEYIGILHDEEYMEALKKRER